MATTGCSVRRAAEPRCQPTFAGSSDHRWHRPPRSYTIGSLSEPRRRTAVPIVADHPSVGFVGLGVMGTPMAGHLADAGYPLAVYDRDPEVSDQVARSNPSVRIATSPADLARTSEIVFTMLPDGRVVNEVAAGDRRAGARPRRRFAPGRHVVVATVDHGRDGEGARRRRRLDGRRPGLGRPVGGAGGRARVHGRRRRRATWRVPGRCSTCSDGPCSTSARSGRDIS